jgi:hypothetical protein
MKRLVYIVFFALFVLSFKGRAQDKLFLRNGSVLYCKIAAISDTMISYSDTVTNAPVVAISTKGVLLVEYRSGEVYIFGKEKEKKFEVVSMMPEETREQRKERKLKEWREKEALLPNGILGFYIPEIALGRLTVSYERLFANKSMGIKIPVSLTYDGLGALNEASANSSSSTNSTSSTNTNSSTSNNNTTSANKRTRGTGFITGIDVNYYHDLKPQLKYYFGPRIRYGTDMTLGGIEGITVQLQNGIMKSRGKRFTSTLGFGIGFFKLSEKYSRYGGYEPNQVYPWASFTWRLGFRL